jgi:hypothetical protein
MTAFEPMKVLLATDGSAHSRAAESLVASLRWPPESAATVVAVVRQPWSLLGLGLEGPGQVRHLADLMARRHGILSGVVGRVPRR